jgi:hypothetical protein
MFCGVVQNLTCTLDFFGFFFCERSALRGICCTTWYNLPLPDVRKSRQAAIFQIKLIFEMDITTLNVQPSHRPLAA